MDYNLYSCDLPAIYQYQHNCNKQGKEVYSLPASAIMLLFLPTWLCPAATGSLACQRFCRLLGQWLWVTAAVLRGLFHFSLSAHSTHTYLFIASSLNLSKLMAYTHSATSTKYMHKYCDTTILNQGQLHSGKKSRASSWLATYMYI